MKKVWKKAFTLLEMLVVIGIIALVVGIATASYSTAQRKARDTKRKTDLNAIENAFEEYYSICGYQYPTPTGPFVANNIKCQSINPAVMIMPTVPLDPLTTPYQQQLGSNPPLYQLCTILEADINPNYCVSTLQQ